MWAEKAGYDDPNLKNKYLCEMHFSTVYISKTPRRTVLLPNAVPYHHTDNVNTDENYEEDYSSEKNATRDEITLDHLDEESDIIYSDTIEVMRHKNDAVDEENVDTLDDTIVEEELNVKPKIKLDPVKVMKIAPKSYDHPTEEQHKKLVDKVTNSLAGDFLTHVTKRQKLHTSADNIIVPNHKAATLKTIEKHDGIDDKIDDQTEPEPETIDNTVNNPDITTFIYKGEEYIQMPKRIYLQQRTKLDADIKRFRRILQDIKGLVNSTD